MALAGLIPLIGLAACSRVASGPEAGSSAANAEAAYVAPPVVLAAQPSSGGVVLSGSAAPLAKVNLGAPSGEIITAEADGKGAWTATVPLSDQVRFYGLRMNVEDRVVQSEGYLVLTPNGAAQLRSGGGARVIAPASRRPRILAIDYDAGGGAVVSGVGTPNAYVGLRVDRAARGESTVDAQGRFAIPLLQPLSMGGHEFEVAAEGGEDTARADVSRPAAPSGGPYQATRFGGGWRIDWVTPNGGLQTTLLTDRAG